ncbi:MAG TPA: hypothetical protein PLE61_10205 [Vicinamibacterales bacterium]|nr:hypothetical protein [Vicinamibacterales bacterium]
MTSAAFSSFHSFKLEKGLYLEQRKGMRSFRARASIHSQQFGKNTDTNDFRRAELIARSWFRALKRSNDNEHLATLNDSDTSVFRAARLYFNSLDNSGKRANAEERWKGIRDFFRDMDVADVGSKVLRQFLERRRDEASKRKRSLTASTLHKDLVLIRQVLKAAVLEEWISVLPMFPSVGKIPANPRPWLDQDEWKTLQRKARERIREEGLDARTKKRREELYDFCLFLVHSCCRVDEARRIRVRDCVIKKRPTSKRPYLEMRVVGKTGPRLSIGWSGAALAFKRQVERFDLKADDLLFREHHRDSFRELLIAAGLRTDAFGFQRNLKSLRSTALMMRIKQNPRINLKLLADNAGTSVAMLDAFYLKRLRVDLAVDELV